MTTQPVEGARSTARPTGRSSGAELWGSTSLLQRNLDLEHASYFLSRITITPTSTDHQMRRWRKLLFTAMARNAASPIDHFNLPVNRTVTVGSQIGL